MPQNQAALPSEPTPAATPWKVLIVDDDEDVHSITRLALKQLSFLGRTLDLLSDFSAESAFRRLKDNPEIAVIILDVVMETRNAGLELVHQIRDELKNQRLRIILRTGQPGEAPEESVIVDYDIFDYKAKTELTRQKLITTVICALRSYNEILNIENQRLILREQEAINQARGAFLANMSHELKTPLSVMMGSAELMEMSGELDESHSTYVRDIMEHGRILNGMITNVLDMSRKDAGFVEIRKKPMDLPFLLGRAMEGIRPLARNLNLKLKMSADVPRFVLVDEQRFRSVLVNLLSNAVKYTDRGEVELRVSTAGRADEAGRVPVDFQVRDTGIGIPAGDLPRIFDSFTQAGNRGTREGTGLGLAICRENVDLMGGDLLVESTEGEGSRFFFQLVLEVVEQETEPAEIPTSPILKLATSGGESPRILLVDSGLQSIVLLRDYLNLTGFQVRFEADGDQAREAAANWRPDLVLVDARLPTRPGAELIREIRAQMRETGNSAMKIMGMSSPVFQEQLTLLEEAGCSIILNQPVAPEDLLLAIGGLLNLDYIYKEPEHAENSGSGTPDLSAFPTQWRANLLRAARKADDGTIILLTESIASENPDIARQLRHLAADFQFREIMKLCRS